MSKSTIAICSTFTQPTPIHRSLLLLTSLGDIENLQSCRRRCQLNNTKQERWENEEFAGHTWGQALLQLVGFFGILEDKRIEQAMATDLELDLLRLAVLFDPCR